MKYIASVSFGKDSLAMLLLLIAKKYPLDEVVFYDTGKEFKAIYDTRDKIIPLLYEKGIKYTELHPVLSFDYKMFEKPVCKRGTKTIHKYGYSWCGGTCRWGTTDKLQAIEKYCKGNYEYVGIAADEKERLIKERKGNKLFPLADWKLTERDCKKYCYTKGFKWLEITDTGKHVELYRILKRVSCWCCRNKNLKELKNIYKYFKNTYWKWLKKIQSKLLEPMKGEGKSIFDLEIRFKKELSEEN